MNAPQASNFFEDTVTATRIVFVDFLVECDVKMIQHENKVAVRGEQIMAINMASRANKLNLSL